MASTPAEAKEEKNPRGIPRAPFIANVEEFLGGPDAEVEVPLKTFQDAIAKYRFMDSNLNQRRQGLEDKIPDIQKTLSMVEYLRDRQEGRNKASDEDEDDVEDSSKRIRTTFELNDTLFAEAELEVTDTVYLWLGANVMLSYKIPAALALLKSKLEVAQRSLANTVEDLEFLREQLTIMEVNTARVYNWDVKRRKDKRAKQATADVSNHDR